MAEDHGKEEEKFDFTSEGEGYISLDEARVLAVRTAVASPGDYGRDLRRVTMVFEVSSLEETDDFYEVTLSFRPQGNFDGTPGQEQFVVGKEGVISVRQVLSLPTQTSASSAGAAKKGGGFPMLPVAIGLVVIGIIAAVGAILLMSSSGGDSVPIAAVAPTETPAPTQPPAPTETPVNIDATVEAGIQKGLEERPTSMPVPTATYTPIPPTETPTPTPTPTPVPPKTFSLTTSAYPSTGGAVGGSGVYLKGTSAVASATPKSGYAFGSWSGDCSGTGRCVVTMNANKTVTANFSLIPPTPTPTPTNTPRPTSTPNGHAKKGDEYFLMRNWNMAIQEYTKSIHIDPNHMESYWSRGRAYKELGQYQNSIDDYTSALQLDPTNFSHYSNRGVSYFELGQYQNSIDDYDSSIQLKPDSAIPYNNKGNSYHALGQYQNAINEFTKSIQLDPDYALAYRNRGNTYRTLYQATLADADETMACSLDSRYC